MDIRIEMEIDEFNEIEPYEDEQYLTMNHYDYLLDPIRLDLLNQNTSKKTYTNLTYGQKLFWNFSIISGEIMNGGIKQFYWNQEGENLVDYLELVKLFNDKKFTLLFNISFDNFNKNRDILFNYKQLDLKRSEYIGTYLKVPGNDISYGQLYEELVGDNLTMYFINNAGKFERKVLNYINNNPSEFIK